jgi:hypothetical protein
MNEVFYEPRPADWPVHSCALCSSGSPKEVNADVAYYMCGQARPLIGAETAIRPEDYPDEEEKPRGTAHNGHRAVKPALAKCVMCGRPFDPSHRPGPAGVTCGPRCSRERERKWQKKYRERRKLAGGRGETE